MKLLQYLMKQTSLVVSTIVMTKATGTIKMPAVKTLLETKPLMVYVSLSAKMVNKLKGQISIGLVIYVVISMIILVNFKPIVT